MKNLFSFSSAPLAVMLNSKYYDLDATLKGMLKLKGFSVIEGFEFQHLAEWNKRHYPMDIDPRYDRINAWNESIKYNVNDIAYMIKISNLPIFSIHGNRDIGILLCSKVREDVKKGRLLIDESINLAVKVNSMLCVYHIWDTKNDNFDLILLKKIITDISIKHPNVILSVENIPTSMPNFTPFELVKDFKYITMDLRWCAAYDELIKFSQIKEKIVNIHIRGELEGDEWKLKSSPFTIEEALDIIKKWKYKGIFTFEPEGGLNGANWDHLIKALNSIRSYYFL